MFTKLLVLLGAFISGKWSEHHETAAALMSRLSHATIRKVSMGIITAMAGLILFGLGVATILADITLSSYGNAGLVISQVSALGGVLVVLSVVSFALALNSKWLRIGARVENVMPQPGNTQFSVISEAASAFIYDMIEERKFRRAQMSAKAGGETVASETMKENYTSDSLAH